MTVEPATFSSSTGGASWSDLGGSRGGALVTTVPFANFTTFLAPAGLGGDRSGFLGGSIAFDLFVGDARGVDSLILRGVDDGSGFVPAISVSIAVNDPVFGPSDVVVAGGGASVVLTMEPADAEGWYSIVVPFVAGLWNPNDQPLTVPDAATEAELLAVLSNVGSIEIGATYGEFDFISRTLSDTSLVAVDNVRFVPAPAVVAVGAMGMALASRRRR